MKRRVLFSLVSCGIMATSFSQNATRAHLEGSALWLKGSTPDGLKSELKDSYHFNFNPIFLPLQSKDLIHKNILESKYSLFVVLKSDVEEEVSMLNLKLNGETTTLTNKQLINDKNNTYKKVDAKQGMILTYLVDHEKKGRKKSSVVLENLSRPNTEKGYRSDIMELLYYPRVVNDLEKKKIESYLSIKHGISLLGEVDYINSEGKKIWNHKDNESYNNRVTGIGKDEIFHLDQKQSGNAEEDGLYIGLGTIEASNQENAFILTDKTFLVWGDNDGTLKMEANKKEPNDVKRMKRVWKIQSSNESQSMAIPTQLMIDKVAFSIEENKQKEDIDRKDDVVWLLIDRNASSTFDYHNAEYYMQSRDEEGRLFFDNIKWDTDKSGADSFTFIKGPDFFVDYVIVDADCSQEAGAAEIAIIGGKAPFKIDYNSVSGRGSYNVEERLFFLPDLDASVYEISVTDKMQRTEKDTLNINGLKDVVISLASQWYLGETKEVIITPEIENPEGQNLAFIWKRKDVLLSTEKQFIAVEEGEYTLVVSNEQGCQNELLFKVESSNSSGQGWVLYPNPAKMDEPFKVRFNLEKESDVSVSIFDFSNKLLKSQHLGKVKDFEYSEKLSTIGTFLIVVTIDGKAESTKIIIR